MTEDNKPKDEQLIGKFNNVWRESNHVYFHADVTNEPVTYLLKELRLAEHDIKLLRLEYHLPDDAMPIWLHVNSYGGLVNEGLMLIDVIRSMEVPVYSVIEGCAMSAGTFISGACQKRYIRPNAYTMIHQLSGVSWGTYEQMKSGQEYTDKLMKSMINFYAALTRKPKKAIREMLKRDTFMTAQESIDFGLCQEII